MKKKGCRKVLQTLQKALFWEAFIEWFINYPIKMVSKHFVDGCWNEREREKVENKVRLGFHFVKRMNNEINFQ